MREFEGRSLQEIAASLEISRSAVETLLFRARRSLREQLEESLSCLEAEHAISRQLDGLLPRRERGALRAHLRRCDQCAALARCLRAQRGAMRSLAILPLPASLVWSRPWGASAAAGSTTGAAAVATAGGSSMIGSVVAKVALGVVAATAVGGVGYEAVSHHVRSAGASGQAVGRAVQPAQATGSSSGGVQASNRPAARRTPAPLASRRRRLDRSRSGSCAPARLSGGTPRWSRVAGSETAGPAWLSAPRRRRLLQGRLGPRHAVTRARQSHPPNPRISTRARTHGTARTQVTLRREANPRTPVAAEIQRRHNTRRVQGARTPPTRSLRAGPTDRFSAPFMGRRWPPVPERMDPSAGQPDPEELRSAGRRLA